MSLMKKWLSCTNKVENKTGDELAKQKKMFCLEGVACLDLYFVARTAGLVHDVPWRFLILRVYLGFMERHVQSKV